MTSMALQALFIFCCILALSRVEATFSRVSYLNNQRSHDKRQSNHDEKEVKDFQNVKENQSCGKHLDYNDDGSVNIHLRFDHLHVDRDDMYMCTAIKVPYNDSESFITKFVPHASMSSTHHMLVYGCNRPGRLGKAMWHCGGMSDICDGQPMEIMYAWARDAPPLTLPEHIGYSIGGKSKIKYLVVQMHYARKAPSGNYDCSGLSMMATQQRQEYYAGVVLLGAYFINIPPHSAFTKVDVSCVNPSSSVLNVFAFRTHAHDLGKVITGYRVRDGNVTMIGKGNPQWPHAFYPRIGGSIRLLPGDDILARCTFASKRSKFTHAGMGGTDEMCNFYMMYYSDSPPESRLSCWGNQIPGASQLFPDTANDPAPYPGYAGQASADALASGVATKPKTPDTHHHHHEIDPPKMTSLPDLPTPKVVTIPPSELEKLQPRPELEADASWPDASFSLNLGQVGGVAVDQKGRVHVFHRAYRRWGVDSFIPFTNKFAYPHSPISNHTMAVLDPHDGAILHSWGRDMFFMPHGVTVDSDENLWLTDVGMHQVFKFPLNGGKTPLLTLGVRMKPGNDEEHFCKPTDVAVDGEGAIYVSDGYCNGRIVKFHPDGRFMKSWGEVGSMSRGGSPLPFYFNVVHSIAMTEDNEVCAADRENGRVQCFTLDGGLKRIIEHRDQMGKNVYAIAHTAAYGGLLYAINGIPSVGIRTSGFTMRSKTGALLGTWNPSPSMDLNKPHDIAVSPDGKQVYVGQLSGKKVYKFHVNVAGEDPQKNPDLDRQKEVVEDNGDVDNGRQSNHSKTDNIRGDVESVTLGNHHRGSIVQDIELSSTVGDLHNNVVIESDTEDPSSFTILFVVVLVTAPVAAMVIACFIVRSRKRRLREYQDLLSHDDFEVYEDKKPEKNFNIGTFLAQSKEEKKGFVPLKNEVSDDDAADSEDELYSNVMTQEH